MGGIKFKVHPLFLIFGVYYAVTGRIATFIIYTLSALSHELGHSIAAGNLGYALNKITLMPFGAVVSGNIDGLKSLDQLKIAMAGPLVNLVAGLIFVSLWWVFPETYAFTDIAAEANIAMFAVNVIPVMPLDGGRVLNSLLLVKLKKSTADIICRITGVVLSTALLGGFVFTLFRTPNFSLLFFSLFALVGTFGKSGRESKYVRVIGGAYDAALKRGVEIKRQAVDKSVTIKRFIRLLDNQALNEIAVFEDGKQIALLSQKEISEILQKGDLYSPLARYI